MQLSCQEKQNFVDLFILDMYTISEKRPLLFLGQLWQNDHVYSHYFTVNLRKDLWRNLKLKLPDLLTSVALLYLVKCKWSTIQLYSTVNSVQSDAKTFNYSKCSRGMLFICLPSSCMHAPSGAHHWSMDALTVLCSTLYHVYIYS